MTYGLSETNLSWSTKVVILWSSYEGIKSSCVELTSLISCSLLSGLSFVFKRTSAGISATSPYRISPSLSFIASNISSAFAFAWSKATEYKLSSLILPKFSLTIVAKVSSSPIET